MDVATLTVEQGARSTRELCGLRASRFAHVERRRPPGPERLTRFTRAPCGGFFGGRGFFGDSGVFRNSGFFGNNWVLRVRHANVRTIYEQFLVGGTSARLHAAMGPGHVAAVPRLVHPLQNTPVAPHALRQTVPHGKCVHARGNIGVDFPVGPDQLMPPTRFPVHGLRRVGTQS